MVEIVHYPKVSYFFFLWFLNLWNSLKVLITRLCNTFTWTSPGHDIKRFVKNRFGHKRHAIAYVCLHTCLDLLWHALIACLTFCLECYNMWSLFAILQNIRNAWTFIPESLNISGIFLSTFLQLGSGSINSILNWIIMKLNHTVFISLCLFCFETSLKYFPFCSLILLTLCFR